MGGEETGPKVDEDKTLNFLDSLDDYLLLIETLSSTLRQGWMELAGARYSMGASRLNTVLLDLKHHSAATTLQLEYQQNELAGSMTKSPHFTLCKWASSQTDNIVEEEKLKGSLTSPDSEKQEDLLVNSYKSETNASSPETETYESPRKTDNTEKLKFPIHPNEETFTPNSLQIQKERAKVLSVFGTLVSPKLRASQLSFETALETLVKIANARSSILETHSELQKDIKSTKE